MSQEAHAASMRLLLVSDEQTKSFPRPDLRLHPGWSVQTASRLPQTSARVDLVIAFQDRPKQFTQAEVFRCLEMAPLLRIVLVLGPWCDGDLRTPGRLSGVHVLRFSEAHWKLAGLVEEFHQGKGTLTRPLTALSEQSASPNPAPENRLPLRVGICMPAHLARGAAECVRALGHAPVMLSEPPNIADALDVVLVDSDCRSEWAHRNPLPILHLQGFSRTEDGATLAKHFLLADLETAIQSIAQIPSS